MDGRWTYPGRTSRPNTVEDYDQIETYRNLAILVEKYCFERTHPAIQSAANFLFSRQTEGGDFRGIYGQQYTPNYTAGIMELLIKAGYQDDERIQRGFDWLLSIRQDDGGWAIPIRTLGMNLNQMYESDEPLPPSRSKPSAHLVTGMVLRAFAAHPSWRKAEVTKEIACLLAGRIFKPDAYVDHRAPYYWTRVSFPFWFTDIVSSLDSLTLVATKDCLPQIQAAITWLKDRQEAGGNFDLKIVRGRDKLSKYWISLAICRIYKRFYKNS